MASIVRKAAQGLFRKRRVKRNRSDGKTFALFDAGLRLPSGHRGTALLFNNFQAQLSRAPLVFHHTKHVTTRAHFSVSERRRTDTLAMAIFPRANSQTNEVCISVDAAVIFVRFWQKADRQRKKVQFPCLMLVGLCPDDAPQSQSQKRDGVENGPHCKIGQA